MAVFRRSLVVVALSVVASGFMACGQVRQQADAQFGDQNFKSAIALIELHKVRFGAYPDNLRDLKFTGTWDLNWLSAVEYKKLDEGYELNLVRGWMGTPGWNIQRRSGRGSAFVRATYGAPAHKDWRCSRIRPHSPPS